MHATTRWAAALTVTAVAVAGVLSGCPGPRGATYVGLLEHDGLDRTYRVHLPPSFAKDGATPLVLVLHGAGGTGVRMERLTGFNTLADREEFVVAYPDGLDHQWNDGRGTTCSSSSKDALPDDVGFLTALIDRLVATHGLDAERVYVTGVSNGGMMSYRLVCERADVFAAAAPVIGNVPVNIADTCASAQPMPMLIVNGTADPLVPWDGGEVTALGLSCGEVLSVEESVGLFVDRNGCAAPGVVEALDDLDPDDGVLVTRTTYGSGCVGAEVVLYTLDGGGHVWPGRAQYAPVWLIGPTTQDMDATETIWAFFAAHPATI
ncbi:MAG: prolyl oligopeptidase family serine peptidase [bacterium]|nr:prolyl oligopeptidase family serine peptidase [bacterium]